MADRLRFSPVFPFVLMVALALLLLAGCYSRHRSQLEAITFSRFLEAVDEGTLIRSLVDVLEAAGYEVEQPGSTSMVT